MLIRCDHCGDEMLKEEAFAYEDDELVYFFCSLECMEEKGYTPEREEEPEPETAS